MDNYPGADPIPDPDRFDSRYATLMEFLSSSTDMRKTATSSFKQSLWAGSGAMVGGMMFGPVGGLVGGITGSLVGFVRTSDYDGAVVHLCKLDQASKKELLTRVGQVLIAAGAATNGIQTNTAFRDALFSYATNSGVRDQLWDACMNSLQN
mmetsp:Transcript_26993/g.74208  ORF Transcript_26993/g.74208 Transcript_26993/m.74208 type:complete len:151 (+) Transcript_26993:134-586(+)